MPQWLSMSSKGEERELNTLLLWMSKKLYFQNRYWSSSCTEISTIQMFIWSNKGMNISSFLSRSQALAPARQGLFHGPGPTAPFMGQGMSRNRENSAIFLSVKLCSRNSWRWSSTEYFTLCLKGVFWRTTWLNEADIPPGCLGFDTSLGRIFQRGLYLSTFYVVLAVPVKEVCHYFIKPFNHLRPWGKSYCPISTCG